MTQRQAVNAADADGAQHQGERTWYVYDAGGQRVRKVTELATGQVKDERIYLGGFEIYRRDGRESAGARDAAHHGRQAAHRPGGDAHRRATNRAYRRSSSATSSATTSARPAWSWTTRRRSSPTRSTRPTAARRIRRCAARRRRRSGIGTRARSGMRRAGCTTTARGTTRHGWAGGRAATRKASLMAPTAIATPVITLPDWSTPREPTRAIRG